MSHKIKVGNQVRLKGSNKYTFTARSVAAGFCLADNGALASLQSQQ